MNNKQRNAIANLRQALKDCAKESIEVHSPYDSETITEALDRCVGLEGAWDGTIVENTGQPSMVLVWPVRNKK